MREEVAALLPFYVLGALTGYEKALVEAYFEEHPEEREQLLAGMARAEDVAFEATPMKPSPQVKQELMNRVRADKKRGAAAVPGVAASAPRRRGLRRFAPVALAFAGLALLALFALSLWTNSLYRQVNTLAGENEQLQDEVAVQRERIDDLSVQKDALQQELEQQSALVALLSAPVQSVAISGTEAQPGAEGRLTILQDDSAILAVSDLQPLPTGRTYQLWLFHDDVVVPAGTFETGSDGAGMLRLSQLESPDTVTAVAVSEEPEGGSEQPTGDVVMFAES